MSKLRLSSPDNLTVLEMQNIRSVYNLLNKELFSNLEILGETASFNNFDCLYNKILAKKNTERIYKKINELENKFWFLTAHSAQY